MEKKNSNPGSSRTSDLVIITPDELAKLGLFQELQRTIEPPEEKGASEQSIFNLKQDIKNKIKEESLKITKNQPKKVKLETTNKTHLSTQSKVTILHTSSAATPKSSVPQKFSTSSKRDKDETTQAKRGKIKPIKSLGDSNSILNSTSVFPNKKPLDLHSSTGIDQIIMEGSESVSHSPTKCIKQHIFKTDVVASVREVINRCNAVNIKTKNSDRTESDRKKLNNTGQTSEETIKKEVTVISNMSVSFSNEDLKNLVSNAKSNSNKQAFTSNKESLKISSKEEVAPSTTESNKINQHVIKQGQKEYSTFLKSSDEYSDQKKIGHGKEDIISKESSEVNEHRNININIGESNIESLTNSKNKQKRLLIVPPKKRITILKDDRATKETLSTTEFRNISELVKNKSKRNLNKEANARRTKKIRKGKYPKFRANNIVKTYVKNRVENPVIIKKAERDEITNHSKVEQDGVIEPIDIENDRSVASNNQIDASNMVKSIVKKSDLKTETNKVQEIPKINMENKSVSSNVSIQLDKRQNTGSVDKNITIIDLSEDSTEDPLLCESSKTPEKCVQGDVIQNKIIVTDVLNFPKKKRGRPKKSIDSPEIDPNGEISPNDCHLSSETKSGEMITSTPVQRKRGRKKKSEMTPVVENITEINMEESRSGRKRKKINYFEMENNVLEENKRMTYKRQKTALNTIEQSKKSSPKKLKIYGHDNNSNSTISCEDDPIGQSNMDTNQEESNLTMSFRETKSENIYESGRISIEACKYDEDTKNYNEKRSKLEIIKESETVKKKVKDKLQVEIDKMGEEEDDGNEDDENPKEDNDPNESSLDNPESPTEQKVKETKGTRELLNTMFSAAFKSKSKTDELQADAVENKSYEASEEIGMVTCATCDEKVNNEKWGSHNREIHYNLAWRKGEPELHLDDIDFVTETLTPILQEEKTVKCYKCEKTYKTVKRFSNHMKTCNGIVSSSGCITCAICKEEMEKNKWFFHKQQKHNNLAWQIGATPMDLTDQSLVLSILNALYKAKKPLRCEKCGCSKKSVVGFLSHQAQCGDKIEEAKVKCQLCDRRVLPASMQSHIKFLHETPKKVNVQKDSSFFNIDTELSKRKAAQRAIDKLSGEKFVEEQTEYYHEQTNFTEETFVRLLLIQEMEENSTIKCKFKDCVHETDQVTDLLEHMDLCQNKPEQYFTCKKCLFIHDTEDQMVKHMKTAHHIDIIDDDFKMDALEEDELDEELQKELRRRILNEKKKIEKDVNYKVKPTFLLNVGKQPGKLFSQAYNYTMEFCQKYFSLDSLFVHLRYSRMDWKLLDDDLAEKYLPKCGQSCDVAVKTVTNIVNVLGDEYLFKKFELFETERVEGTVTIFCGGPIHALAWMPTPYTSYNSRQVLAVATANDFDTKYLVNVNYNDSSVIQFWDFGVLANKQNITEPQLMFCLAFDFGPVWHLEWCPSGCFDSREDCDEKMSRLGLIAVAGTDSVVYIYSIPSLEEEQMGLIYKVKPLLKLCLVYGNENLLGKDKFYATKISWSMGQGHKYVAVGYSDGMVGLFDIDTKSIVLRCKDDDGVDILLPYKSFQAHSHYISALTLIHLTDGKRWLFTGSFDRYTYVWDLHDGTKYFMRKCIVSDGVWLANWMLYLGACDESSTNNGPVQMFVKSYRNYLYDHVYMIYTRSSITSVSASSWLNGFLNCTSVGEIIAFFPHQMTYAFESDKCFKNYTYVLGYTKLIDKHKSPNERVAEEKEKQKALKPVSRRNNMSDSVGQTLGVKNNHYNKYEPMTYLEACEKYGLTFCDMKLVTAGTLQKSQDFIGKCGERLEFSKPNLYSMQAINKIAYNPNRQASLYYATGYQMGFVRLTYMKFLEKDPQIL